MKKVKLNKKSVIAVVVIVVLVAIGTVIVLAKENKGTLVKNYVHPGSGKPACKAYTPECGVCLGKVIDKKCYESNTKSAVPSGYKKVNNYNKNGVCLALSPECGVCNEGIVVGEDCYVKK